jgi:HEXXH motif-containing protein
LEVELASLSTISAGLASDEAPRWSLVPSAARVDGIDRALRIRLADSLNYLGELASLDAGRQAALVRLEGRLRAAPVSPWVFCLYSELVAELSKDPRGDVAQVFDAVFQAAALPAEEGVMVLGDSALSDSWWDHFQLLLDTDRKRPFRPRAPDAAASALCKQDIERGFDVLRRADPIGRDEVRRLLRMIVLGAPASLEPGANFNGASTFFLWGATLINADLRRSALSMVDLLVHESSHVLLFGLAADGALTRNSGQARYASPLRSDARPIDGIFHACFVATRVHQAMSRLLESKCLSAEETEQARERRQFNGDAARISLDVLASHAQLTELGEEILGTIRAYWANMAAG